MLSFEQLGRTGCFLEIDLFGNYVSGIYPHNPDVALQNDAERVGMIKWLIGQGFGTQILISQDICNQYVATHL